MDDRGKAVRKFEVTVDRVHDATRCEPEQSDAKDDIKINPLQVKHMMKSFRVIDSNNDNTLDIDELGAAFRLMGQNPTKKKLQDIAKEADVDGSGGIDEQEFTRLLIRHMRDVQDVKEELKQAFAVFDTECKGKVNKKDLINTVKLCGDDPLTDREVEELMTAMDTNKDGIIDINEFVNFLCKSVPVRYYTTNPSQKEEQRRETWGTKL